MVNVQSMGKPMVYEQIYTSSSRANSMSLRSLGCSPRFCRPHVAGHAGYPIGLAWSSHLETYHWPNHECFTSVMASHPFGILEPFEFEARMCGYHQAKAFQLKGTWALIDPRVCPRCSIIPSRLPLMRLLGIKAVMVRTSFHVSCLEFAFQFGGKTNLHLQVLCWLCLSHFLRNYLHS